MKRSIRKVPAALVAIAALVAVAATFAGGAGADPGAGGQFVIGDGNAAVGSQVTFWGAQWWKDNTVSGGTAPPSFKGYALDVDAVDCTFTSLPGNSAPPPDGPLPGSITVIVTSSVTKDGRTISGTILGFAQVTTDPGYEPDPGHPGTGMVVTSFVPCGATF